MLSTTDQLYLIAIPTRCLG